MAEPVVIEQARAEERAKVVRELLLEVMKLPRYWRRNDSGVKAIEKEAIEVFDGLTLNDVGAAIERVCAPAAGAPGGKA